MNDLSGPGLLVDPPVLLVAAGHLTAAARDLRAAPCCTPPDAGRSSDEVAAALALVSTELSDLSDRIESGCAALVEVAESYTAIDGAVTFPGIGTFQTGPS